MLTKSLIRAFKKVGITPTQEDSRYIARGYYCVAAWFDQEGSSVGLVVTRYNDQPDSRSDYFPGSYPDTIKQAIAWTTEEL